MTALRKWRWVLAGWLVLGLLLSTAVSTSTTLAQDNQDDITDDEVNAVAKQLFCPTCENTPVDTCPTQTCSDWRAEIRQQLAEGRSEDEILAYFADYYGSDVLANPPQEGFGLVAWVLPIIVVITAVVGFGWYFYHLHQQGQTAPTTPVPETNTNTNTAVDSAHPTTDKYRSQLEEELNK